MNRIEAGSSIPSKPKSNVALELVSVSVPVESPQAVISTVLKVAMPSDRTMVAPRPHSKEIVNRRLVKPVGRRNP